MRTQQKDFHLKAMKKTLALLDLKTSRIVRKCILVKSQKYILLRKPKQTQNINLQYTVILILAGYLRISILLKCLIYLSLKGKQKSRHEIITQRCR